MREYGDGRQRGSGSGGGNWQEPPGGQSAWAPAPGRDSWAGQDDGYGQDRHGQDGYGYPPPRAQAPRGAGQWEPQGQGQSPAPSPRSARAPQGQPRPTRRNEPAPTPVQAVLQSKYFPPLVLILLPLLGAVVSGPGLGLIFAVAAVGASAAAAYLCKPGGLWWIVPSTPTALLVVAFAWVSVDTLVGARTTVAAATGVFDGIAGAFPGIAAGTAAALIVAVVRVRKGAADMTDLRGKRG